jgi:hypothetical protein
MFIDYLIDRDSEIRKAAAEALKIIDPDWPTFKKHIHQLVTIWKNRIEDFHCQESFIRDMENLVKGLNFLERNLLYLQSIELLNCWKLEIQQLIQKSKNLVAAYNILVKKEEQSWA